MDTVLHIECPCGFSGSITQAPMDERELTYGGEPPTNYCPKCGSDDWTLTRIK